MHHAARQKLTDVIHIDYKSELDDTHYEGQFTVKKLSIADRTTRAINKAKLNGGMHYDPENPGYGIDPETDSINGALAHLSVAIVTSPPWWNLDQISDMDLIIKIYKEVIAFEDSFRGRAKAAGGSNAGSVSSPGGGGADQQANSVGAVGQVVDPQIQAALEP